MVIIPNIHFSFRKGGGSAPEIVYGTVELRPTTPFQASTSLVLPAPTTIDLINGEGTATNVYPTPAPVNGQVEWAYRVKVTDRHGKTFEWMVGVPDSTGTVEFASLPRYYETKPPLFGQGPKGDPGQAATISIGTTTSGTTPSVTNSGTNTAAVLNFTLPKGDKGDTGAGVPTGGTALQYIRKNAGNTATEWVSATNALATTSSAGFMAPADKALLNGATFEPTPNTLIKRSASGRVNYPEPVNGTNPVTRDWYYADRDAVAATMMKKNSLVVNVKDFGAVGNGITDDTDAVQAAIDFIGSMGGGTLYYPPGRYWQNSQVVLADNMIITGNGATLVKNSGSTRYLFFAGSSGTSKGYGAGASNIICYGLTFEGTFGAGGRGACAFALHHSQDVLVYGCRFKHTSYGGHRFDLQGCRRITIRDNIFEGFDNSLDPTSFYNEDIQLDYSARAGLSFEEPSDLCFDGLGCTDINITGNRWVGITVGGVTYPAANPLGAHGNVVGNRHQNVTFENNYVGGGLSDTASFSPGRVHFMAIDGLYIRNNTFEGGGSAMYAIRVVSGTRALPLEQVASSPSTNIDLDPHYVANTVVIEGNTFQGYNSTNASLRVIHIAGTTGPSGARHTGVVVRNNTFKNNKAGNNPVPNDGPNLIEISEVVDAVVSGNRANMQRRLIIANGLGTLKVADNLVSNSSNNVIGITGVDNLQVQGNILTGNTGSPAIVAAECPTATISGNQVASTSSGIVAYRVNTSDNVELSFNKAYGDSVTLSRGFDVLSSLGTRFVYNTVKSVGSAVVADSTSTPSKTEVGTAVIS